MLVKIISRAYSFKAFNIKKIAIYIEGGFFFWLVQLQKKPVSKFIESYLAWKLPLEKYGLKPDHPFVEDYAACQMTILPENFFYEADEGRIEFKRSSKWWFWEGGIELEDNTKLEADVVFLCTGFDGKAKLESILPVPFCDFIENSSGIMPLYRYLSLSLSLHATMFLYMDGIWVGSDPNPYYITQEIDWLDSALSFRYPIWSWYLTCTQYIYI